MFESKLKPGMTPMTLIEMVDDIAKATDYEGTPQTVTVPVNVTWDIGWMLERIRLAHERGFIDDKGNVAKVAGKLAKTADDYIMGVGGELWCDFPPPGIDAPMQCSGPVGPVVPRGRIYGERANAEAAMKARG